MRLNFERLPLMNVASFPTHILYSATSTFCNNRDLESNFQLSVIFFEILKKIITQADAYIFRTMIMETNFCVIVKYLETIACIVSRCSASDFLCVETP